MGDLDYMMLMPFLFFFLFFMAYLFRKRKVEKILFSEFDESEKDLEARDFFNRILKIERSAKAFYYAEVIFLIIDTFFILFRGYKTYLEEVEFVKEFPSFSISPLSSTLTKFMIPIFLWVLVFFLIIFAMIMKKKENKRITEILNDLEKAKLLNSAQKDFFKSNEIVRVGKLSNDIKLGDKYIFTIYPAYIIPYSWIKDVKVTTTFVRNGTRYYLNFIFKNSWKPLKIFSPKEILAEEIKNLILNKKNLNEKGVF